MISCHKAVGIALDCASCLPSELVTLTDSLGRVLAEDILSDVEMPPFNKSAMDGFACRRTDLGGELVILETIPAGQMPTMKVQPGTCSRIMTGAPVPEGADCVIMVEHTAELGGDRIRHTRSSSNTNICLRGEDVRVGDVVLHKGELITAAHFAVLAAVGYAQVPVARRPRVAIIATGSELVEPAVAPVGAQIRNSNSYQLIAQIQQCGAIADYQGVVEDRLEALAKAVAKAAAENDLVLLSGGVSVGDFDFVPAILKDSGFETSFHGVNMKPGRHVLFGKSETGYCCGLPGNPVSTYVVFEMLVKPFLYQLMGHKLAPELIPSIVDIDIVQKRAERESTIPVRFVSPGRIAPISYHGSAHIHAVTQADALLTIPVGATKILKGTEVFVRKIS